MTEQQNIDQQQLMMKFQMFEQQIRALQQQLQAVEQAIVDIGSLNLGLDDLKGQTGKEIKAPIGRGIYVDATLNSEDLLVDIGNRNYVKKSIDETKELMKNQILKLEEVRDELNSEMDKINQDLTETYMASQGGAVEELDNGDEKEGGKE